MASESLLGRTLFVAALLFSAPGVAAPEPGLPEFQLPLAFPISGGSIHQGNGNLLLVRRDLDIDTRIGNRVFGATYNSASRSWRFHFELHYDGNFFIDPSGARHDLRGVGDGKAVPGTVWVRIDHRHIATKGGLLHRFDDRGALETVAWRSDPFPRLVYRRDGQGRVTSVVQQPSVESEEPLFELRRDPWGRLIEVEDRTGRIARYAYDADGRIVEAVDPKTHRDGGPGARYEYTDGNLVRWKNPEGEETRFRYEAGRVAEVASGASSGLSWRFRYQLDASGAGATERLAPGGERSRLRFDSRGRVLSELDPAGVRREWSWSDLRPVYFRDGAGRVREFRYLDDDLVEIIDPSGTSIRWRYAQDAVDRSRPFARPIAEIQRGSVAVDQRRYDGRGRLIERRNGMGESWRYGYGDHGALASLTAPWGSVFRFHDYGPHGHPARIQAPSGASSQSYDGVGNLLVGLSPGAPGDPGYPGTVGLGFDPNRNLEFVERSGLRRGKFDPPVSVRLRHRSDGRLLSIERPGGGDSHFSYDPAGRLVRRSDRVSGSWHTTLFEYDEAGRLREEIFPNGMTSLWAYDPAGRVVRREWRGAGFAPQGFRLNYAHGELSSAEDLYGDAGESYDRDSGGVLSGIEYEDGRRLALDRDVFLRITRAEFLGPDGELEAEIDQAYDLAGREVVVASQGRVLLERRYRDGRLVAVRYGNGLTQSFDYDARGLRTSEELRSPSGEERASSRSYRSVSAFPPTTFQRSNLRVTRGDLNSYLGDLLFLIAPDNSGAGALLSRWHARRGDRVAVHYEFDALGNRSGELWRYADRSTRRRPDPLFNPEGNRLLRSSEGIEFTHDEAGFTRSRGGVPLDWSAAGQLIRYGEEFRGGWDPWGRPRWHRDALGERHFRFGGALEVDGRDRPTALDLGYARLDLSRARTALYRHSDHRGHVVWVSDSEGQVVSHAQYSPFGLQHVLGRREVGPGFDGARPAGPLWLVGARPYDPTVGRFLAPDPVQQIVNAFAYAGGNPIWFQDRDGRQTRAAFAATVGLTAAGFAGGVALAVSAPTTGAVAAGIGLASFSAGIVYGVGSDRSDLTSTVGTAIGVGFLSLAPIGGSSGALFATAGGFLAGFGIGQDLRSGILQAFPPPGGLRSPAPFTREPTTSRRLDLRVAPPALPSQSQGSGGGGCTPRDLRGLPTPSARLLWFLVLSAPAQWLLFRAWLRRGSGHGK